MSLRPSPRAARVCRAIGFAFLASFSLVFTGVGPVDAAERTIWRSTSPGDVSVFRKEPSGDWIEMKPDGRSIRFEESGATDDYVELLDRGRAIRIRLGDERSRLKQGDRDFFDWLAGGWTDADDVPEWAYLAPIDHTVRLVYFVPKDREPTPAWREKIVTLMTFVNEFYRDEFRRRGLPDRGLVFETDENDVPIVHLIRGQRTATEYNGAPEYEFQGHLRRYLAELPRTIGDPSRQLVVSFLETYDSGDARFEWLGGMALGGQRSPDGGTATFSAWILRDEFCATSMEKQKELLRDATPIQGRIAHGYGRMNSPRFEFIEDGFGAVIHEVGHSLGLPHDQREDSWYVMGNGFRRLRLNLDDSRPLEQRVRFSDENARLLARSRHLNPDWNRSDRQAPRVKLSLSHGADGVAKAKLELTDDRGLAAYLFFDQIRGSVVDGAAVEGTQASLDVDLTLQPEEGTGVRRVEAYVVDRGGRIARVSAELPATAAPAAN